jgi:rod shape-determining protein MreC
LISFKVTAKRKPTVLLVVLLALHWVMLSFNPIPGQSERRYAQAWITAAFTPFQTLVAKGDVSVRGVWNQYFSLRDSRLENERLRAQNVQLNNELLKAKEEARLGEQLRALVNWQAPDAYERVAARVVSRDSIQWFNSVVINQGTLSGISKDQPVVTPEGLVGRVIEASLWSARVLLLTDERHGAGAIIGQLADSRILGVVKGRNNFLCEMKFVAGKEQIEPGGVVITSGQDGIYPKGLVIGRVTRIEIGSPTVPAVIEIEPAAPLAKLETVSVLLVKKEQIRGELDELLNQEKEKQLKPSQRKKR